MFIFGFIIGILFYILLGLYWLISLKDRNKPYVRTRKPYRVWQEEYLQYIKNEKIIQIRDEKLNQIFENDKYKIN